jgi:hypothetical protein
VLQDGILCVHGVGDLLVGLPHGSLQLLQGLVYCAVADSLKGGSVFNELKSKGILASL